MANTTIMKSDLYRVITKHEPTVVCRIINIMDNNFSSDGEILLTLCLKQ